MQGAVDVLFQIIQNSPTTLLNKYQQTMGNVFFEEHFEYRLQNNTWR